MGVGGKVGEGLGKMAVGEGEVKGVTISAGAHPARTTIVRTMIELRMSLLVGEPCLGAMDTSNLIQEA